MTGAAEKRLLVVSHPCVVPENQSVYLELRKIGWDVSVVVPRSWPSEYATASSSPASLPGFEDALVPLAVALAGREQRYFHLANPVPLIKAYRPDVIFIEQEPFSVSGFQWGMAAVRAGVPFGLQSAETLDRQFPRPARMIRSWTLPRARFIAARSPTAAGLVERWGAKGRVAFVPHAVPGWGDVQPKANGVFTVGFAGRLTSEKGVLDLIEAVRLIGGHTRLLLVGAGPLHDHIDRMRSDGMQLEIRSGVLHHQMAEAYSQMDVLVLPSRTTRRWAEQFGRVLAEALWCRVPVVGSDSGEIPWLISTTRGGVVYPEGDSRALADTLVDLRESPDKRRQLGKTGREAVGRLFSTEAAARTLDEALNAA